MEAIFSRLLEQLNSSVFTLLAILAIAFWVLYKLGGIVATFTSFKDKHKDLDGHIGGMKETLASIKATTDLLYQAHLSTIQSHSPVSLTDIGKTISDDLHIDEKITKHWNRIAAAIEERNPSNPYDIQTVSMDIARDCFDVIFSEAERNEIKSYAYEKGKNLLEILPIIGILVRDRFLKEKQRVS